jgi:chromosome segregation ATPase
MTTTIDAPVVEGAELAGWEQSLARAEVARRPIAEHFGRLEDERNTLRAFLDATDLATDPLDIATAQARIAVVEREIERVKPKLAQHDEAVRQAKQRLQTAQGRLRNAEAKLAALSDITTPYLAHLSVLDWTLTIRSVRHEIKVLTGEEPSPITVIV